MTTIDLINSAPQTLTVDAALIAEALDAAAACAVVATACASACLSESAAEMQQCVRDDLDCADLCEVTAKHLARLNRGDKQLTAVAAGHLHRGLRAVRRLVRAARRHHEHCRLCLEACRRCETACQALLDALKAV
jgi:hypothetical protein